MPSAASNQKRKTAQLPRNDPAFMRKFSKERHDQERSATAEHARRRFSRFDLEVAKS